MKTIQINSPGPRGPAGPPGPSGSDALVPPVILSGSAQIASDISGSFTAPSSSISTRLTLLEGGTTSKTLISGSAQLATEISGAFKETSASLNTRTNALEANPVFSAIGISGSFTIASSSLASRISANETITSKTLISSSNQFNNINFPFTGSFTGSFIGNGSGLENIPASGITGLNLSRIASGSATASISPNSGLFINTNLTASNISASSIEVFKLNVTHFTASFITASTIETSGSNIFGDEPTDTHTFIGNIIAQNNISSSGYISASNFIGNGSGLTNVFEGTSASESISTRITSNELVTAKTLISGSTQITAFGFVSQSGGIVDLPNVKIQYANVYPDLSDLPSPSNYHGMFAHVHSTGKGYFAHAGAWIELANISVTSSIDANTTAITALQTKSVYSGSFSGSFSGSYVGDGSQLSGIVTETNFTQSLFVTPSGDNSTAVVGDMMKPFSSILGATGSANLGDTIIVYPGTYIEDRNLYKDGVNYHFLDGAKVVANSPVEPMWGGGTGQSNIIGTSFDSPISITGHGEFISTASNTMASAIFYIQVPSGVIEFKRALKHGIGAGPYQTAAGFGQLTSIDPTGVLTVRGKLENSGSASSYCQVVAFGQGNINTDIVVRSYNGTAEGVRLWSDNGDINGTMDVYSEGTGLLTQARTSALSYLKGRFETLTSNQGTYYALYFGPGYRGSFHVDAEIRGAIYINPGSTYEGSVHVRGYQEVSNSPGGGANVIGSGHNQLSQKIYGVSGNAAFKVTGGRTTYDGQLRLTGYNAKVFDISAGSFNWKGTCTGQLGYPTNRTDPNIVSGGELIIESQFESFSDAASVNNEYMFNLSGGTLDIQSKLRNNIDQANNGIINMTGGYLRMNGAELVHATQTGSFAYAIDLNNAAHSGSILNNCFTNLTPFGNIGSFTNEIVGGGTLFESHKLY